MKKALLMMVIFLNVACDKWYNFEYDIIVTDYATNLGSLNSGFDDYNSDLPYPGERMEIYFSSNRNSSGRNFSIVPGIMDLSYHVKDDHLNVSIVHNSEVTHAEKILPKVNSRDNEYGPYTYYSGKDMLFMYATGANDTFDIKFIEFTNWNYGGVEHKVTEPLEIAKINDVGANLYPSVSADKTELFWCSNRNDTVFNIYSARYSSEITKQSLLDGTIEKIEKNETLSSSFDDKCPYVKDNIMVFASNRPGGFGGYDLWYSRFENNTWSSPVNFGEKINSEYDEFRPVSFKFLEFDLMIFSSNRPEGNGGFDLYMVRREGLKN